MQFGAGQTAGALDEVSFKFITAKCVRRRQRLQYTVTFAPSE